jgi:hypothetical protein
MGSPGSGPGVPPERYRGERLRLAFQVAPYARSVLVAGHGIALLCGILKRALGTQVVALELDTPRLHLAEAVADVALAREHFDALEANTLPRFDMAVLVDPAAAEADALLRRIVPALLPEGPGLLALMQTPLAEEFSQRAAGLGLVRYARWEGEGECLLRLVQPAFNLVDTARQLLAGGHPEWAYNELMEAPEADVEGLAPFARDTLHTLALECLKQLSQCGPLDARSDFLVRAQLHLYNADLHGAHPVVTQALYAEILECAGGKALAADLRKSLAHAMGAPLPPGTPARAPKRVHFDHLDSHFTWPGTPPRILFVIHPAPHFGLDVLYDGLCLALGDAQVVDWPNKPTLHGEQMTQLANYPCAFNHAGRALSFDEVLAELDEGRFDVVLLGDCEGDLPGDAVRMIAHAARARGVPLVLVDETDESMDFRPKVQALLGVDGFDLYCKREMADFWEYEDHTICLPFAFVKSKVHPQGGPRDVPLFWAGHRNFGLRRVYLEYLEQRFGWDLSPIFTPAEYAARLCRSRAGLCFFGKGYDTVRYYELPAHGAMLIAERPPLNIPHNFVDGESAVFFDTLPELEAKLEHYLAAPEECARIAEAGRRVYEEHHTTEARARQLLHALHALKKEGP